MPSRVCTPSGTIRHGRPKPAGSTCRQRMVCGTVCRETYPGASRAPGWSVSSPRYKGMASPTASTYFFGAFSAAMRSEVSTSLLKVGRSIAMPLRTVLQWREIAARATASLISSSVAP